ncbi:MAG: cysteine desulfurase [Deltaproteobacteria bacterium]|nr:cysteine desulfurase [Deltaproteobacteria bacterium]MBW1875279.1 cysteine desulfurase [Deltaproteobacteria bacterium]MBW2211293.1 cysteine desulfurase [Deltaproteobacteria bacterium]MBW2213834.1 cysteine desulfurase [Deltaproteobacteria bacterium]MBW2378252.1 cysteine desulfurase [Deltaproteobacteria bacterium]
MSEMPIYMDHHATTPVDERVLAAMLPFFAERFGNAASGTHAHGRGARDAVERGRAQVAQLVGAKPNEVIFTSGATESDNLALRGVAQARLAEGKHIVTVRTEHKAVLDTCAALEHGGWRVTWLDVDPQGLVSIDAVANALTDETVLVSVMLANNEVGVVHDLAAIGALTAERGITFHCDASQGLGYLPFSVEDMNIDLASVSAHKMYGPKGVGALYVRESLQARGIPVAQMLGGGHERGLRSGTLNVPGIVGFGAAAEIMANEGSAEATRIESLRDRLKDQLLDAIEEVRLNGAADPRHPGNLNLSFGYVDGARLLLDLCEVVSVSSGTACSSAELGPSYVLEAMGVPKDWSAASVRFGLGRATTAADVQTVAKAVIETVEHLRERSPLWARRSSGRPVDW